ncbi:autotransporter outer membrane beta-barrel domain-containing protein [Salmonella enterica]|nr:autotransporter outer membrane beta-barrel domain-containing protein [Salmonella enterica]EDS0985612.1 autotransporter outer membrane beta-barrel domain-containing protein [Salmonella enterica]EDU1388962.1 autotransporter outer membrane beta-barrel domain-containing protein [Salmonella enterica subsp. enterica serovar Oranienburg]EFS4244635.1 autotransporter outer membrane beta-barrel domain-containing protein [Salmonella enterica]
MNISNLAAANQIFVTRLADGEGGTAYINPVTGERDITSLWLRQEGGHNRSRADSLHTTGNRYVAQLGGELVNGSFTEADLWDIGLMAGYANQKSTTTSNRSRYNVNTKSQLHGYSAGLYGTWYQDAKERTGLYVDSWVQYSWFRNSVSEDGQLSDSYKSRGFSASLESGYSWKVVDGERTDFFIQPQAQLVWSGIKADSHYTQNGIRVQGQGENNLQSRLGLTAYLKGHGKLDDNTGRSFKPFVEANWIHNTERYGVRMDGDSLNQDGAKDIAKVKTGIEAHLTPSTSLWGSVGVQMGDKGYSGATWAKSSLLKQKRRHGNVPFSVRLYRCKGKDIRCLHKMVIHPVTSIF